MSTKPSAFPPSHEYADIFPLDDGENLVKLSEDIGTNGQQEPVWMLDGKILDGRRRFRACVRAGIEPKTKEYRGSDPLAFVVSKNLHRRHLQTGDRAIVAARIATLKKGYNESPNPQECGLAASPDTPPLSQADAAELMNVSVRLVQNAADVLEHGAPELIAAVTAGEVTVTDAASIAGEPEGVQKKAVAAKRSGKAKTVKAAVTLKTESDTPQLDGWGIPITAEAAKAFEAQDKFDDLLAALRKVKSLYKELAAGPGGEFLTRPGISVNHGGEWRHAGIETAIMNVKDCRPKYTVCPYAYAPKHKHDKSCNLCRGLGWTVAISKSAAVPEELIKAAQKANGAEGVPF